MSSNNYYRTGVDYLSYDSYNMQYSINKIPVLFGYRSNYIKSYKNITTMEQFLADKLAEITYGTPYQFIKNANICWYENCMPAKGKCMLDDRLGNKRPNSPVNRCAMTLLNKDKIECLLECSMFSVICDAIDMLISNNHINNKVGTVLRRYF